MTNNLSNNKIAFVILHYNAIKETIDCVKSIIKNIDSNNYHVIIVDNCSPNGSGDSLLKRYEDNQMVSVILANKNLGFANGNNLGIDYARNEIKADYVCCLNNDTLIQQNDFFATIIYDYERTNAAVIGPKVYLKDGSIQKSPPFILKKSQYEKQLYDCSYIVNHRIQWNIKRASLAFPPISHLNSLRHKNHNMDDRGITSFDYNIEHENVVIHGCCIVFTPVFFSKLNGFNTNTFLYHEEELLFIDCRKNSLNTLYTPNLSIVHLEDAATKTLAKSNIDRIIFKAKNEINSLRVLLKEFEDSYGDFEDENQR